MAMKIIEKGGDNFEEREVGQRAMIYCLSKPYTCFILVPHMKVFRQIVALEQINHPNCVALLEIYESPSKFYLVTEL